MLSRKALGTVGDMRAGALITIGAALLVVAVLMTVTQLGYAWKNSCARFGPVPAAAILTDAGGSVHAARSWWPIGSVCDWKRVDGDGTVRSEVGDDAVTAATYGIAALGVLSIFLCASRRRQAAPAG
jgi:hypothetical protein